MIVKYISVGYTGVNDDKFNSKGLDYYLNK